MDLLVLSLPEASFLYLGLAIQALVRQSSLVKAAYALVLWMTIGSLLQAVREHSFWPCLYLGRVLLVLTLFWPEAVLFGNVVGGQMLAANQVASYAASQDANAEIVTAEDTQMVPQSLQRPAFIPPGFRLLLRIVTETPLTLARVVNSQTHRMFNSMMPMQWLLGMDLTSDITSAVADWVHNCYLPVQTGTMEGREGRTIEELLPWGNTPMRQGLTTREVMPGAQTGITWLRGPTPSNRVRCDVYLDAVEVRTQAWLYELRSPNGTPLLEVFDTELGIDAVTQARFLIYREMLRAAGPAVPAPSLTGIYGTLKGAEAVGSGLLGFFSGGLRGSLNALGNQFTTATQMLSWFLGIGVFLLWFGPYILGIVTMVLVGLFTFVILWTLIPGKTFEALAHYSVALLFACSSPLWFALIDQAQRLAGATTQQPPDTYGVVITNWLTPALWGTAITVIGLLLVPLVTGILLFLAFRSIGHLWRPL